MLACLTIVVVLGGGAGSWIFLLLLVLCAFFLGRGIFLLRRPQSK
ncbi:hypothetical protein [Amycolatopsis plumensis]|uniref:PEP-CTERM protein-sorting domain-containing protein n=1 Tax=Amycolatopsis plumensis TaxID=236508 RepID=A0ABV5UFR6_9PSEU